MSELIHSATPWWQSDDYDRDLAVPAEFLNHHAGPRGVALVRAWPDGRTDAGWGLVGAVRDGVQQDGFMPKYVRGEFDWRRVLHGYMRDRWAFAFVMRSVKLVCIDIDGKNGGLEHAKRLGVLPPTLSETSKSGNGYHLFYEVEEEWDDVKGFGLLGDRIGIEQGVDIRATGCVYHHKQQRWNNRKVVVLPDYLKELLQQREQKLSAVYERIDKVLDSKEELEVLMLHDEILSELKKPIAQGKRNNTLFAIGNQMRQAQVPDWESRLGERATEVGLDGWEVAALVRNIQRYGSPVTVP